MIIRISLPVLCCSLLSISLVEAQFTLRLNVNEVQWSPDGQSIAVVIGREPELQSIIRIYDANTLQIRRIFWNVSGYVYNLAWSPDSQRILTNDDDDNSNIRNVQTGAVLGSFGYGGGRTSPAPIFGSSQWNYDGSLIADMYNRSITVRNGRTANNGDFVEAGTAFTYFAWSDQQNRLAIGTYDNTVLILDPITQKIISQFRTDRRVLPRLWNGNYLYTVQDFNSNVDLILDTDLNGQFDYHFVFQVWDVTTGQVISAFDLGKLDSLYDYEWSPDGRWLAVKRPGHILQIWDAFKGVSVQSQGFHSQFDMTWSPDSSRLALAFSPDDLQIISLPLTEERIPPHFPDYITFFYDVEQDGGRSLVTTRVAEAPYEPSVDYIGYYGLGDDKLVYDDQPPYYMWSKSGTRFLYASSHDANDYQVYENLIGYAGETVLTHEEGWNLYPVYSPADFPDDAEIAYVYSDDGKRFDLYLINPRRTMFTRITDTHLIYPERPAWLPDARKRQIAFATQNGDNSDIVVIDLDQQTTQVLIENSANDHYPAWSPDGQKLAFVSDRTQPESIFVFDITKQETCLLTSGTEPEWSPDGSKIVFTRGSDVYIMDANGDFVTLYAANASTPRWVPNR